MSGSAMSITMASNRRSLASPKRFQPAGHRLDLETRPRQHQGGHHPAGFAGIGQQDALLQGCFRIGWTWAAGVVGYGQRQSSA